MFDLQSLGNSSRDTAVEEVSSETLLRGPQLRGLGCPTWAHLYRTSVLCSTGIPQTASWPAGSLCWGFLWNYCHWICSSWTLLFLYQCTNYFTYLYIHITLKHAPDSYDIYLQIFAPFFWPGSACATYYIYYIYYSTILGCYANILHCVFLYIHMQYILYLYALLPNCVETKCNKLYSVAAHRLTTFFWAF